MTDNCYCGEPLEEIYPGEYSDVCEKCNRAIFLGEQRYMKSLKVIRETDYL